MLIEARDICAVFFLETRLGILRERYLSAVIEGKPTGSDYLGAGEKAIMEEMKRKFYNPNVRALVNPSAASRISDDEDFTGRSQKLAEQAILMTHRKLAGIPFVGQPQYREA